MISDLRAADAVLKRFPVSVVTTDELTLHLRFHRYTIERLVRRGVVRPIRVCRCWRFDREDVFPALGFGPGRPVRAAESSSVSV